jgi:hypothetical protein
VIKDTREAIVQHNCKALNVMNDCKKDIEISDESFEKVEKIGYGGFEFGIAS